MIFETFANAATITAAVIAAILGVLAVLLLALVLLALLAMLAGWLFDKATARLAAWWIAKGVKPRGGLARILYAHAVRDG